MSESPALEFQPKPGCLVVLMRGRDILEKKVATIQAIAEQLKGRGLRAALIDARGVPGAPTFMDRFQLGVTAGRFLCGIAIGVLARVDQADPQKLGQLVARNRGVDVEVFTESAAADAWLQKHAAKI
jgi:hypothetical protein